MGNVVTPFWQDFGNVIQRRCNNMEIDVSTVLIFDSATTLTTVLTIRLMQSHSEV